MLAKGSSTASPGPKSPNDSTVIDLEGFDDFDALESPSDISESGPDSFPSHEAKFTSVTDEDEDDDVSAHFRKQMQDNMTDMLWKSGKDHAQKAFNMYAKIDILRPYFDVEPSQVRNRLLASFVPVLPTAKKQSSIPGDLYGPCMIIFTLIAILLFQMKVSSHRVEDGTLMGTAFGLCFTYWFGCSAVLFAMSYMFNTKLRLLQILSLLGYAMFSYCVVLFLSTVVHAYHSHLFFYAVWMIFGGLAALRLVAVFWARTGDRRNRVVVAAVAAAFHLLFLMYLHFAFHEDVVEFEEVIEELAARTG